jgi:ADP-dependent NAD(P)H-hydrate dehydratase / NAD(P)H-hydrate epimerase
MRYNVLGAVTFRTVSEIRAMSARSLVASCAEARALDQAVERELGLGSSELMEIAGSGCFLLIRELVAPRRVIVAAGPGQNGGDGFVIARYAIAAGWDVSVFAMKRPSGGPAATQLARLEAFGAHASIGDLAALEAALGDVDAVVVDALFGTGVSLPLRSEAVRWVDAVNRARGRIVSVDLPSGLDGDSGAAPSGCVLPAITLAIGLLKPGLVAAGDRAGRIEIVPLPYPPRLTAHLRRGC